MNRRFRPRGHSHWDRPVSAMGGEPEGMKNTSADYDDADIISFGGRQVGDIYFGEARQVGDIYFGEALEGNPQGMKNTGTDFDDADVIDFGDEDEDDDLGDDACGEYPYSCDAAHNWSSPAATVGGMPQGMKNTSTDFDDADIIDFGVAFGSALTFGAKKKAKKGAKGGAKKGAKGPSKGKKGQAKQAASRKPTTTQDPYASYPVEAPETAPAYSPEDAAEDTAWLKGLQEQYGVLTENDNPDEAFVTTLPNAQQIIGQAQSSPSGKLIFMLVNSTDADTAAQDNTALMASLLGVGARTMAHATRNNVAGFPIFAVMGRPAAPGSAVGASGRRFRARTRTHRERPSQSFGDWKMNKDIDGRRFRPRNVGRLTAPNSREGGFGDDPYAAYLGGCDCD